MEEEHIKIPVVVRYVTMTMDTYSGNEYWIQGIIISGWIHILLRLMVVFSPLNYSVMIYQL